MAHIHAALIRRRTDFLEVVVDAIEDRRILLQRHIGLTQVEGADIADREDRVATRLLGLAENTRRNVEVVIGLSLVNVARAAARDTRHLDQFDLELLRDRARRRIELFLRKAREATGVVCVTLLHGGISLPEQRRDARPLHGAADPSLLFQAASRAA